MAAALRKATGGPLAVLCADETAAETLCASFYDEYGVDAVIIRPGHIYGPTASEADNRVSSAWPYAVARGEDLVMKSDGSQLRSYCHCLDTASAILTALLTGETMHPYNISDPACVISIRDMGELLAKAGGVRLIREEPTELENIVLLCHDAQAKKTTVEALPKIIEHYQSLGYTFEAIDRITADMYTKLDPKVCVPFLTHIKEAFLGSRVMLNNGMLGTIVRYNNDFVSKPLIRVNEDQIIDLNNNTDIKITEYNPK